MTGSVQAPAQDSGAVGTPESRTQAAVLRLAGVRDCAVVQLHGTPEAPDRHCSRCGMTSRYPDLSFDEAGVCSLCSMYVGHRDEIDAYWRGLDELAPALRRAAQEKSTDYDCLLLFSGGKDSTYVLYRLVELGLRVMTFTFDNGFISRAALRNVEQVTAELGIDHLTANREDQKQIFLKSLREHDSVCNGCFRSLLELSTTLAHERGIPTIVTGLSRGQIMDERLAWFHRNGIFDVREIEQKLATGRVLYHHGSPTIDENAVNAVDVVDFYRYSDVTKDGVRALLRARSPLWSQPGDTGFCSSNCLINDVGVYVHTARRGYHNYEAPTRWEVRLGHLDRAEADLELQPPTAGPKVTSMLAAVGYPDPDSVRVPTSGLTAFYVAEPDLDPQAAREELARTEPAAHIPDRWVRVAEIPRRAGVLDLEALQVPSARQPIALRPTRGKPTKPLTTAQLAAVRRGPGARVLLVDSAAPLNPARVRRLVLQLLIRHDALRSTISVRDGKHSQAIGGIAQALAPARVDLSPYHPSTHPGLLEAAASRLRSSLNPASGAHLRSAVVVRDGRIDGLLLAVHELAADVASWQILMNDLSLLWADPEATLPPLSPVDQSALVPDRHAEHSDPLTVLPAGQNGTAALVLAGQLSAAEVAAELGTRLRHRFGAGWLIAEIQDHQVDSRARPVGCLELPSTVALGAAGIRAAEGPVSMRYEHYGDLAALLPAPAGCTLSRDVDFTTTGSSPSGLTAIGRVCADHVEVRVAGPVTVLLALGADLDPVGGTP